MTNDDLISIAPFSNISFCGPPQPEEEESDEDDMYQLDVIILKAENLKVMDEDTGLSDPFCKVTLGDEQFFTNVRRKTLNPYWGETAAHFKFDVDQEERKKMKLKVAVYDDDDDGDGGGEFIGQVVFLFLSSSPPLLLRTKRLHRKEHSVKS